MSTRTAIVCRLFGAWLLVTLAIGLTARGDVFRWDNGEVIPGTEGIAPGPGVQLQNRQLEWADLISIDLTGANFNSSNLSYARFWSSTLSGADMAGAAVNGASFYNTTANGFTKEQLYSTASYLQRNLQQINLRGNDLSDWDLSGQDLTNAVFGDLFDGGGATLTGANLAAANLTNAGFYTCEVTRADFYDTTTRGFTKEQLYSTANYQAKSLSGIGLGANNLTGWDFSGQDLTDAFFAFSTMTAAKLAGAIVTGASFGNTTSHGFTKEQLYSTASYQQSNLRGIELGGNDLTDWDLSGQDLTNAGLGGLFSKLTKTKLTDAIVTGADLGSSFFPLPAIDALTKEQLYSTASYKQSHLQGIGLGLSNLSGWDFSGQDLTSAYFGTSVLTAANLSRANLKNAYLAFAMLTSANLSGANLTNANFDHTTMDNADLTATDLRGARDVNLTGAIVRNAIRPDGMVVELDLVGGEELVVRDDDGVSDPPPDLWWLQPRPRIPITVHDRVAISNGAVLSLVFESDPWDSLISFEPGILVQLGGTLELTFATDVDPASQVGRTLHIFDWTGVTPNDTFGIESPYLWDVSQLYSTGEVTLLAIPEPASYVLTCLACALMCNYIWRRRFIDL
jgi:uncharacterized protein YjbI with pentapeptide repeats